MTVVTLGSAENAFARGGNRLCYVDPRDANRCIKVLRPDRSPAKRRAKKGFPKNLRPVQSFDDNHEEFSVMTRIERHIGEPAFALISRCFGYVSTTMGEGLCSELIRDTDGLISITLKQYLWEYGVNDVLNEAVERFSNQWQALGMPSRNLLLHNIVTQRNGDAIERLVVIDGLGWADIIPAAYVFPSLARRKAARKIESLHRAIDHLLYKKANEVNYGVHGWLADEKRKVN